MTLKEFYNECKEHRAYSEVTFNKATGVYNIKLTVHRQVLIAQVTSQEMTTHGNDYVDTVLEGMLTKVQ